MRRRAAALLFAFALLLCACAAPASSAAPAVSSAPAPSAPPSAPPSAEPKESVRGLLGAITPPEPAGDFGGIYSLYLNWDTRALLDGNGALRGKDYLYGVLYDTLTKKPAFYTRTRYLDTGERTEWGEAVAVTEQALYGLDGTLLIDWNPYFYRSALGGTVARTSSGYWEMGVETEDAEAALVEAATGRVLLQDVAQLYRLDDRTAVACDTGGTLLGTLDAAGNPVAGFPAPIPLSWPDVTGTGLLIGRDPDSSWDEKYGMCYVLDRDLEVVMSQPSRYINAQFYGLRGPYALGMSSDDVTVIYDMTDWTPLLNIWEYGVEYFDGELLIYSESNAGWRCTLCDAEGNILAGPFLSRITPINGMNSDAPAEAFLVADGGRIVKLDRSGRELAACDLADVSDITAYEEGLIVCSVNYNNEGWRYALLDADLNLIVAPEHYMSVYPLYSDLGEELTGKNLWCAHRVLPNGRTVIDLLDKTGTPVIDGISNIGTATNEAIAVARGQIVGLIDYKGNWIAQNSIYDAMQVD